MSERQEAQLEDAGAPEAKHASDEETRGEWERAAAEQDRSEHLHEVLDDAREAARKAHEADSMASRGQEVEPQDVQDFGSGDATGNSPEGKGEAEA